LPATDQSCPAVDQGPMTNERPGFAPPRSPRPENAWQVVIGRLFIDRPGSSPPGRHAQRSRKPKFCESLEHRSPPFSALRGGPVSERGRLCATTHPHATSAVAANLDVLRQRWSDRRHQTSVAIGSTAHVRFIRVEMPARTGCPGQRLGTTPAQNRCQALFHILPGGWLLSSGEDRRFECRTTPILQLPDA
jgi:hypothetical protein